MTTTRAFLVAMCTLTALSAGTSARALPVDQYLKLRRQVAVDRKLTYPQVETNPAAYVDRVIEMRGKVNGSVRRDASISFLLSMDSGKAIMLTAPPADTQIVAQVNNQMLRVLATVTNGSGTNLVPLEVLGIAYDSEVSLKEKDAESRQAAVESQRQRYTPLANRPDTELTSRGGYYARPGPDAAAGGMLSEWAKRYLNPEAQSVYPRYKAFIHKCNRRLSEEELDAITVAILYFSVKHQVDPRLVVALIIAESDFNPRSTSHKGAMGLGQIMPDEARNHKVADPYNPVENVRACVNLLRMKLNIYAEPNVPPGMLTRNQIMLTLAAYNAGGGAVRKYGNKVPPYRETQGYVKKVMGLYDQFCSGG
jgi:soluble lytic murein transglycosylase-like protein